MVAGAKALASDRLRNGKIRGLTLCGARPVRIGLATPPSLASYMGQRYTRIDPETHAVELNEHKTHRDDEDLFRLAVTDNLVAIPRKRTLAHA
jgi:hypothetical protein